MASDTGLMVASVQQEIFTGCKFRFTYRYEVKQLEVKHSLREDCEGWWLSGGHCMLAQSTGSSSLGLIPGGFGFSFSFTY